MPGVVVVPVDAGEGEAEPGVRGGGRLAARVGVVERHRSGRRSARRSRRRRQCCCASRARRSGCCPRAARPGAAAWSTGRRRSCRCATRCAPARPRRCHACRAPVRRELPRRRHAPPHPVVMEAPPESKARVDLGRRRAEGSESEGCTNRRSGDQQTQGGDLHGWAFLSSQSPAESGDLGRTGGQRSCLDQFAVDSSAPPRPPRQNFPSAGSCDARTCRTVCSPGRRRCPDLGRLCATASGSPSVWPRCSAGICCAGRGWPATRRSGRPRRRRRAGRRRRRTGRVGTPTASIAAGTPSVDGLVHGISRLDVAVDQVQDAVALKMPWCNSRGQMVLDSTPTLMPAACSPSQGGRTSGSVGVCGSQNS